MDSNDLISSGTQAGRTGVLLPFRTSRSFTTLWLGMTLSQLGDSVLWVVLPLTVYSITQSPLYMGSIMGLLMVPQVIFLPLAGVVVDRVSRTQAMRVTESIRCLLVAGMAVLSVMHHLTFPILCIFAVMYGTMDALFQPAYAAARAEIFSPDIRNAALSLSQMSQETARLLGPVLGGIVAGFVSVAAGFAFDSVTLLISVIALLLLRIPPHARASRKGATFSVHGFVGELVEGFMELRKHPWLWITILAFGLINIASSGVMAILLPWLVKVHLHLSDVSYGFINSASGVGAILAAFIYGRRGRYRRRAYFAYGFLAVNGLAFLLLAFARSTSLLMVLMAAASAGMMIFMLIWEGSLQELVPAQSYGRVASLDLFGSWTLLPLGNVVTGWLASRVGGIQTILLEATLMLGTTIFVLSLPAVRRFD